MVISGYGQAVWLSPWERETVGSTPATRIFWERTQVAEEF